jgi:hypothetical protein
VRNIKEEISLSNMRINRVTRQKLIEEIERLVDLGFDREVVEESFVNFLTEEGAEGAFGSIANFFSGDNLGGTAVSQTFKSQILKYVLGSLGVGTDNFLGMAVLNLFANVEFKDYGKLTDCNFVSSQLTKALLETFLDQAVKKMEMDSILTTAIKNVVTEAGANTEAFKGLQSQVNTFICPVVKQIKDKFDFSMFTGK